MGIQLFEHNKIAYDAAVSMLLETGKTAVIHPTGTGKSFIGFKLCEDNADKRICWLSPSSYIFQTQLENLRKTTEGYEPENICFFTYAKLMGMSEQEIAEIQPDFIILDEFHRCGAEMWGMGVQRLLAVSQHVPVLGLSATAIRYLDNQRDMADELFDGNVASEITLGEAVVRGILNPPKYILSVYSYQKDLEKYQRKINRTRNKPARDTAEKYLEALKRTLEMADGLDDIFAKHMAGHNGKYIVFCASTEHMREMIKKAPEWFAKVDVDPHIYSVYSNNPETSQEFLEFKEDAADHLKLLFCIDMLNEGIHVEDIDGVILLRPTVSPIIYKQQIGRALSATKAKHAVIFDIVNNIENIYSIDTVEDEMQIAAAYYRSLGEEEAVVTEHFEVIDEVKDCRELFERLNDTLSASWNVMYEYAKAYYEEVGNLDIPSRYKTKEGYSLGRWIFYQRAARKGQTRVFLTDDQICRLNEIGMIWDSAADLNWERNFAAAKSYFHEHGHLDIPSNYVTSTGLKLGSWLCNLRNWNKAGVHLKYLTKERKEQLNGIGMVWDVWDSYWQRNYQAAVEYYHANGHLDVPADYVSKDGIRLGAWIAKQRGLRDGRIKRGTPPTAEQISRLDAIGMNWHGRLDIKWEKSYREAQHYYEINHHLKIPGSYITDSNVKLGAWIARQRRQYMAGKLSEEKIRRLEEIDMVWSNPDSWMSRYEQVKQYYQKHGNLNISQNVVIGGFWIGKWLARQIELYDAGSNLTEEQRSLLSQLPLVHENKTDDQWISKFEEARKYKEEHGSLNVPQKYISDNGTKLAVWLVNQRMKYKKGQLLQEQIRLLNSIGFEWNLEARWDRSYRRAETFYFTHDNSLPTKKNARTKEEREIATWIDSQRKRFNRGELTQETIERLKLFRLPWLQEKEEPWRIEVKNAMLIQEFNYGGYGGNKSESKNGL